MATTNRMYVFMAFGFSAIAAIFNIVSLSTENWIHGKAILNNSSGYTDFNYINYGLFHGTYQQHVPTPIHFQIKMTCSLKHNICALLCEADGSSLLEKIYNNNLDPDYNMDNCLSVVRRTFYYMSFENVSLRAKSDLTVSPKSFINMGVWLSTIIFLTLAIVIGLVSSVLALNNTVTNPTSFFLSVGSLYYYNGFALLFTILYVILWGTMYNTTIVHNVGLYYTLVGIMESDKMSYLGYSYWISFIPMIFHTATIAILYYREYLNGKDPKLQKVHIEDATDPTLYLY